MPLLAGRKRNPDAANVEKNVMWSSATLRITGMSPRLGITRLPLKRTMTRRPASAIQLRIAAVQSGGTVCTSVFVTVQFTPHARTTIRNRPAAARGDRGDFIAKVL